MDTSTLSIVLRAVDEASAQLKTVNTQLKELEGQAKASNLQTSSLGAGLSQVGEVAGKVGASMTKAVTLPLVAIAAGAADLAVKFQQSMTYVRTDAGDTTDNIQQLSQAVLDLAKKSQFSPDELANGLYHLASLGLRGADAMNALTVAQNMAAVGGSNLEDTATALGGALVTGIKGVQDYSSAAGTLDAIIGAGNMRMQDLVGAIGTGVLPVFKNAGLTITDFGAALATLTDNGQQADAAATHLRMTIALMEAPSGTAKKALEAIGITSTELGYKMQTEGLIPALTDLKQHLLDTYGTTAMGKEQMAAALTEMFGGGRSSAAIQTLLDQLDRVQNKYTQISDQTGEFSNKVAEQQQTASAKIKTAWDAIQADAIQLGSQILPVLASALTVIVGKINDLTTWWGTLSQGQQSFILKTALVVAAVGPLLSIFSKIVGVVKLASTLFSGLSLVFGGLTRIFAGSAVIEEAGVAIAGVGEAAGAAAGVGGLGALAAVLTGPVGIALGLAALAIGGGILWWKHYKDSAKDAGDQSKVTGGQISMLALFQQAQATATANQKQATDGLKQAQQAIAPSNAALAAAQKDLNDKQLAVNAALKAYGTNSPQYKKATDDLTQAELNYRNAVLDASNKTLDLMGAQGKLKAANDALSSANATLNSFLKDQNKDLGDITNTIKTFGPAADLQVKSIANLGQNISDVVARFHTAQADIQGGIASDIGQYQGLGSTIDRLQTTAKNLQVTVGNTQLQGGSVGGLQGNYGTAPVKLPGHALGTSFWSGGLTWVGEKGPEIVDLPAGSKIFSNNESISASTGSGTTNFHLNVNVGTYAGQPGEIDNIARVIYQGLMRIARQHGLQDALPKIGILPQ